LRNALLCFSASSESLISLSKEENLEAVQLASEFAENVYNKMCTITSTEISISVYDMKLLRNSGIYQNTGIINLYRAPLFGRKMSME